MCTHSTKVESPEAVVQSHTPRSTVQVLVGRQVLSRAWRGREVEVGSPGKGAAERGCWGAREEEGGQSQKSCR